MLCLALGVSVVGLVLLSFVSPSVSPPLSRVGDVSGSFVDRVVRLEGKVSRVHLFDGGSLVFTLSDGGSDLDVFLPASASAPWRNASLVGRKVEVSGRVQLFRGGLEVFVATRGGVVLR